MQYPFERKFLLMDLFFLLNLFPYTTFGIPSISDSQPWAVILGTILLIHRLLFFYQKRGVAKELIFLWIMSFFCIANVTVFYMFAGGETRMYLRTTYKYINFAIILPSAFFYLDKFRVKTLKISIFLWLTVASLQIVLKKPIIDPLLPRASYTPGRSWVLGFAPEPAYLAKTATFFLILVDYYSLSGKLTQRSTTILRILCSLMAISSLSITGLFLVLIYLLLRGFQSAISGNIIKKLIVSSTLIALFILSIAFVAIDNKLSELNPGSRLGTFILSAHKHGYLYAVVSDPSFKSRYKTYVNNLKTLLSGKIFGSGVSKHPVGSIFSPIHDSGIYGVFFVVLTMSFFTKALLIHKEQNTKFYAIELMTLFLCMTFSESIATSYVPFIAGIALHLSKTRKN